ncbi:glutathione peroxidase [Diplogelasinospora grovesii]|uniref:Glutathione peroxidase n=1 Tax=Diplogelasinospora grovesii TaxID=303347 RepID=A0AAN6NHY9_9PEZI|nr:glutathione peroxidase [Diplogelasinospora grovesii]
MIPRQITRLPYIRPPRSKSVIAVAYYHSSSTNQPCRPSKHTAAARPPLVTPAPQHQLITRRAAALFSAMASATTFYDFKPLDKKGSEVDLSEHKGKVVLVVNTASKCGFTPQFAGLEKLYKEMKEKHGDDFEILGFPCNQFGGQDPGTDEEIQSFCQINYGVTFPIMQKIEVNGDKASPLYEWMKTEQPGLMGLKRIKWNFEKFLIGKDGKVKGRWASTTKPESLQKAIEDELST